MYFLRTNKLGVAAVFLSAYLLGCGEDLNVNQVWVSDAQNESLVVLIEKAQIAYDAGDFTEALEYAEKAEKISPYNEDIAILIGYINLSLSGMDTFQIAKGLVESSDSSDSSSSSDDDSSGTDTNQSTGGGPRGRPNQALLAESSNATEFFDKFKAIMNLDKATLSEFGDLDESSLDAFEDYDIIEPLEADEARALSIQVMQRINKAVSKICPFVDEDLRSEEDERHSEENCITTTTSREKPIISHFLWAFAHITEAVLFYSIVQYQDEESSEAHINLRASTLQDEADSLSISEYADYAVSLSESMTSVYDVSNENSMFSALVNDLLIASNTFAAIGNLPDKVQSSLTKAVDSIQDKVSSVGGDSDDEKLNNSFKNQINKKVSSQMSAKISSLADEDPDEFEENKDEICEAYETVSGGASIPSDCEEESEE